MARPYSIDGARYRVPLASGDGFLIVATRNDAGRRFTLARQMARKNRPAKPTIGAPKDRLSRLFSAISERGRCPCCGGPNGGKYQLSKVGRQRLAWFPAAVAKASAARLAHSYSGLVPFPLPSALR